jgi:hypothetical protein
VGGINGVNVRLMDRARFQIGVAEAIDRHAAALQALMDRQNAYGEFIADLSLRLDALDVALRELTERLDGLQPDNARHDGSAD